MLPRFADGVWLCELAAAANAEDMVQVVALALGVVQRQQMTLAESIVDFLRTRQMLVVLDNCEHLLDAAAELVEDDLGGCAGGADLGDEPRGVRDRRASGCGRCVRWRFRTAHAGSSDAVVLFADRARAVRPRISCWTRVRRRRWWSCAGASMGFRWRSSSRRRGSR